MSEEEVKAPVSPAHNNGPGEVLDSGRTVLKEKQASEIKKATPPEAPKE